MVVPIIACILALSCFIYVYLALFNHPHNDEYFYAAIAQESGPIQAQLDYYQQWTGRYTTNIAMSLPTLLLPLSLLAKLIPFAGIFLFGAGFYWLVSTYGGKIFNKELRVLAALLLLTFYLAQLNQISESWFWPAAWLNHQLPILLLLLLLSALQRLNQRQSRWRYLLVATLTLFAAGGNELIAVNLAGLYLLLMLAEYIYKSKIRFDFLGYLLLCLGAVLFMLSAPSNNIRLEVQSQWSEYHQVMDAGTALHIGLFDFFNYLLRWILQPHTWLLLAGITIVVAYSFSLGTKTYSQIFKTSPIIVWIIIAMIILSNLIVSAYLTSDHIYPRTASLHLFIFLLGLIYTAMYLAQRYKIRHYPMAIELILMLIVGCVFLSGNFKTALIDIGSGKTVYYNNQMLKAYQGIADCQKSQRLDCELFITSDEGKLPGSLYPALFTSRENYLNQMAARYYKLNSLHVIQSTP